MTWRFSAARSPDSRSARLLRRSSDSPEPDIITVAQATHAIRHLEKSRGLSQIAPVLNHMQPYGARIDFDALRQKHRLYHAIHGKPLDDAVRLDTADRSE